MKHSPKSFGKQNFFVVPTILLLSSVGISTHVQAQQETPQARSTPNNQDSERNVKAKSEPTRFLRVVQDESGNPLSMQTAITRYRPANGELVVDLIGAVHIGESDYYAQLNNQFEHYDVVLYELVAPQGTRVPRGGKKETHAASPLNVVSWMQSQAQSTLGLESQLKKIDYQKQNFIHADMSPTEMGEKMAQRGDTPLTIGLSAITEMMRQQNKPANSNASAVDVTPSNLFEVLGDPLLMKRMMAKQFSDSGVMEMGMGSTLNQLLVVDRNAAALKVMQKEIANGKKKIAIFYGAAHMPDFEKRLVNDFGLEKSKQVWIDAWDLTKAGTNATTTDSPSKLLFRLFDELSK